MQSAHGERPGGASSDSSMSMIDPGSGEVGAGSQQTWRQSRDGWESVHLLKATGVPSVLRTW
jgi:hypothetical protein